MEKEFWGRLVAYMLMATGITIILTLVLDMNSDEFVAVWVASVFANALADIVQNHQPRTGAARDLFDYFEEIEE